MYGYDGLSSTANNLFYNSSGQLVYYTAGVGLVYTKPPQHSQAFFLGHSDDIRALALCKSPVEHNGVQFPAGTLAATGQVSSHEEGPYVCIWDTRPQGESCLVVQKIPLTKESRSISALGFSADGKYLAVVTTDNMHTVYVYDWRARNSVGEGKGYNGEPPGVFGIEWNQHQVAHGLVPEFVTFGRKHIKRWRPDAAKGTWAVQTLAFGKAIIQNIHSAAFLPPTDVGPNLESLIVAGANDGSLYLFRWVLALMRPGLHRQQCS